MSLMGEKEGQKTALTPGDSPEKKEPSDKKEAPKKRRAPKEGEKKKEQPKSGGRLGFLALTALGVVYGDIGTSPLYAVRECFKPEYGLKPTPPEVHGILSLIFWSLVLVISVKYLVFILRADFDGEGGILALVGLVNPDRNALPSWKLNGILLAVGVLGAALLYGDGLITPAISVLSAVEGLQVVVPGIQTFVVPIAAGILLALFVFERQGTAGVGTVFGPVMLVWFLTLGVLGVMHIASDPSVLAAASPLDAVAFFGRHAVKSWLVLGAVVLTVTGGEALYADIGHFGTRAVRLTWYFFVLPALLLNYFGQGALILHSKAAVSNPFFHQLEGWLRYPLVALATAATVIASQAVISGVFSLTVQAIQLGYSPRLTISHTSKDMEGQVYLPGVNYAMMAGCLALVFGFRSSTNLAGAYGVAVTATMVITSILFLVVAHRKWKWPLYATVPLIAAFLVIDLAFATSNFTKIPSGGWFPLLVAGLLYFLAITWKHGSRLLRNDYRKREEPLEKFIRRIKREKVVRSDGTAVFLSSQPDYTPTHLQLMVNQVHALPKRVVLLVVSLSPKPRVPSDERVEVKELPDGFVAVVAKYGYTEQPRPLEVLERLQDLGAKEPLDIGNISYVVHDEKVVAGPGDGMVHWRKQLYTYMYRNSRSPAEFFGLPSDKVVELGARTEL